MSFQYLGVHIKLVARWLCSSFCQLKWIRQDLELNATKWLWFRISSKTNVKIVQHTDDGILPLNNINELCIVINILDDFGNVSGLKLNLSKCEGLWMGKDKGRQIDITHVGHHQWLVRCSVPSWVPCWDVGQDIQALYHSSSVWLQSGSAKEWVVQQVQ